ncbi:MAG TPA: gfo/Idh/MocA family oxidoreductase, partial [Alphaproteobacteria bacterium]|nr:gfo/Idh/MocA family oxidoreductase [Alphaproteobacteria bacterium]
MKPVRWGVLSTARIGRERVIPAMQQSPLCDIHAIA